MPIPLDEPVACFLVEKHWAIDASTGTPYAKPKAFEPKFEADRNRFERSVFRTRALTDEVVWRDLAHHVEAGRGKPVIGQARLTVAQATIETLSVVEDEPPEHHAVIIGWPAGDDNKPERMRLQRELAKDALIIARPTPSTP